MHYWTKKFLERGKWSKNVATDINKTSETLVHKPFDSTGGAGNPTIFT